MVPPRTRLIAAAIACLGVFIADRCAPLAAAFVVILILLAKARLAAVFLKYFLSMLLPAAVMLILIWGLLTRAAPGEVMGSDPRGGALYATMIALRLADLGGLIQLTLLSVPARALPATLNGWGVHGESMVVALGVLAVGPELMLRAEQITTARKARGIVSRGPVGKLREMTRMLRPLFVWSIRSAVHRSEVWHQRALLLKVDKLPQMEAEFSPANGAVAVVLAVAWLVISVCTRFA
jgi:energy-coupling factor transporter transmembrane protein EcfT